MDRQTPEIVVRDVFSGITPAAIIAFHANRESASVSSGVASHREFLSSPQLDSQREFSSPSQLASQQELPSSPPRATSPSSYCIQPRALVVAASGGPGGRGRKALLPSPSQGNCAVAATSVQQTVGSGGSRAISSRRFGSVLRARRQAGLLMTKRAADLHMVWQMMYVSGETGEPSVETLMMIEEIVRQQVIEILRSSTEVAARRGSRAITINDVIFQIRHDAAKVSRLRTFLSWKDVRKNVKDSDDKGADVDIGGAEDPVAGAPVPGGPGDEASKKNKRNKLGLPWEPASFFSQEVPERDEEEDEEEDEMNHITLQRLRKADERTKVMSREEYVTWSEYRQASFTYRKGKRFREWAGFGIVTDSKPSDDIVDILGFLTFEMVQTLTEEALRIKDHEDLTKERSGGSGSGVGGAGGSGDGDDDGKSRKPTQGLFNLPGEGRSPVQPRHIQEAFRRLQARNNKYRAMLNGTRLAPRTTLKLTRIKVQLKLSIARLRMVQHRDEALAKAARRSMAQLLDNGKEESARIRVENIIRSDITTELHEILELYCELLLARAGLLDGHGPCDPGLEEAAKSLVYAAPKTEIKELQQVRLLLAERYGKDFVLSAMDNSDGKVSPKVVRKLSVVPPSEALVNGYLEEIARAYGVRWPRGVAAEEEAEAEAEAQEEGEEGEQGGEFEAEAKGDANDGGDDDDDNNNSGGLPSTPSRPPGVAVPATPTSARLAKTRDELTRATPPKTAVSATPPPPLQVNPPTPTTDNMHPRITLNAQELKPGSSAKAKPAAAKTAAAAPSAALADPAARRLVARKKETADDELARRFAELKR